MNSFIGTYSCKADTKGRVMLPVGLKKQMNTLLLEGFVIKRAVFQPCLELYPMAEWQLLMQNINNLNRFNKKNNDFIRRFTAGVKIIDIDTAGRLLIPKDLVLFSGISKQVVLTSAVNIIEIWDEEKYENAIKAATEDFAELAEEVMGKDHTNHVS